MKNGFTLIELLLVIAVIAILAAMTTPFLGNFIARNNLETTSFQVISFLRKAQTYSLEGKSDSIWGVCMNGNYLRLYTGSCGSPVIKEDYAVPNSVSVTGLSGVTFSKLRGEPSASISVNISSGGNTKSVSVNSAGGMTIN